MLRKTLMDMTQEQFNNNIDWVIKGEIFGNGDLSQYDEKTHADYQSKKDEITAEYNTYQASKKTPEEIEELKASAKAKLIAGEALTEAEADTIVI
tara:strand:+ start:1083 stop:1367 length:285 start_codon:yes stop_codon:yes gene_type:complete